MKLVESLLKPASYLFKVTVCIHIIFNIAKSFRTALQKLAVHADLIQTKVCVNKELFLDELEHLDMLYDFINHSLLPLGLILRPHIFFSFYSSSLY